MANSWSITIKQKGGALTFTPDNLGGPDNQPAHENQPLGVFKFDNVTWNNRTNHAIALTQVYPQNSNLIPFPSIPPGQVSNPIFNVTETIGYTASMVPAKQGKQVFWILIVPDPNASTSG
jgi:hypothetical protein